jgi:hypothetical protein
MDHSVADVNTSHAWRDPLLELSTRADSGTGTAFCFRTFGRQKADLDFDFTTEDRPRLVTDILTACMLDEEGSPLGAERAWDMEVSRRIECLLKLVAANQEFVPRITIRCARHDCRQLIEIELPIADVLSLQRRVEERDFMELQVDAAILRLRRPTGRDQRQWRAVSIPDAAGARRAVLSSLILGGQESATGGTGGSPAMDLPVTLIEIIDTQLEKFDPLVAFSVAVSCPQCVAEMDFPVDLEALALREMEKIQRELLQNVHRLALRYHWNESEILDLTPERRAKYLRLIEAEGAP